MGEFWGDKLFLFNLYQYVSVLFYGHNYSLIMMMYFNDAYIDHGIFKVNIRIYYRKIVSNPPALAQALSLSKQYAMFQSGR